MSGHAYTSAHVLRPPAAGAPSKVHIGPFLAKGSRQPPQMGGLDLQDGLEIIGPEEALDIRTDVVADIAISEASDQDPTAHPLGAEPAVEGHPFSRGHGISIGPGRDSSCRTCPAWPTPNPRTLRCNTENRSERAVSGNVAGRCAGRAMRVLGSRS